MSDQSAGVDPWLRSLLRCPATGTPLEDATGPAGEPELVSTGPDTSYAYPVRDGVPVLLVHEARLVED